MKNGFLFIIITIVLITTGFTINDKTSVKMNINYNVIYKQAFGFEQYIKPLSQIEDNLTLYQTKDSWNLIVKYLPKSSIPNVDFRNKSVLLIKIPCIGTDKLTSSQFVLHNISMDSNNLVVSVERIKGIEKGYEFAYVMIVEINKRVIPKNPKLKLIDTSIKAIDTIEEHAFKDSAYWMPDFVDTELNDGTVGKVFVKWRYKLISTKLPRTYYIYGDAFGYGKIVKMKLVISPYKNMTDKIMKDYKKLSFKLDYGYKSQLNTIDGTYTKDMVSEPPITVKLTLTDREMETIFEEMVKCNILSYPENIKEYIISKYEPNHEIIAHEPFMTYKLKFIYDGMEKNIYWEDEIFDINRVCKELREFFYKTIDVIENNEEYKKLPIPKKGRA